MTSPNTQDLIKNTTHEVDQIGRIHFEGNIIPHFWYENIRFDKGAVDLVSIILLAEIVYWYRPTTIRDEITGQVVEIRKKFKGDALQKSKASLAAQFGFTERQVKDSLQRLEELGLITRDYRVVKTPEGMVIPNQLFIKIHPEKIEAISFSQRQVYDVQTSDTRRSNVRPQTFKRHNTYNTTETTPKKKNICATSGDADESADNSSSKEKKIERRSNIATTETEHQKLVIKFGIDLVESAYDDLSEWKLSASPAQVKKHTSDYRRLTKWVIPDLQNQNLQAKLTQDKLKRLEQYQGSHQTNKAQIEAFLKEIKLSPEESQNLICVIKEKYIEIGSLYPPTNKILQFADTNIEVIKNEIRKTLETIRYPRR